MLTVNHAIAFFNNMKSVGNLAKASFYELERYSQLLWLDMKMSGPRAEVEQAFNGLKSELSLRTA